MAHASRKLAIFMIILMVLLACGWSLFWYMGYQYANEKFALWQKEFAQDGNQLECHNSRWGGFPFRYELRCDKVDISVMPLKEEGEAGATTLYGQDNPTHLTLGEVTLVAMAWKPSHVIMHIEQGGEMTLPSAQKVKMQWQQAELSFIFDNDSGIVRADAVFLENKVTLEPKLDFFNHLTSHRFEWHIRRDIEAIKEVENPIQDLDFYIYADGLSLNTQESGNTAILKANQEKYAAFLQKFATKERPKNLIAPYILMNMSVHHITLDENQPLQATLTLNDGLFVMPEQAYNLMGEILLQEPQPPKGEISLFIADKRNLPPLFAPLLFLMKGESVTEGDFKGGVRFPFQIKQGDIYANNTPLLSVVAPHLLPSFGK